MLQGTVQKYFGTVGNYRGWLARAQTLSGKLGASMARPLRGGSDQGCPLCHEWAKFHVVLPLHPG